MARFRGADVYAFRSELNEWVGLRAQAGRVVPKGFPRSNKFGPAF